MWASSNPALNNNDAFSQYYGKDMFIPAKADVTTIPGVINKTAILCSIAVAAGSVGYWAFGTYPQVLWIAAITSLIVSFGIGFKLTRSPQLARVVGPVYAVVQGVFLGALTAIADRILAQQGLTAMGGVGVQAFIVTAACMLSMLGLYRAGIVKPTKTFKAVLCVAAGGISLAYLVSFVLSIFWQPLPLISFASAVNDTGMMGLLGLGVNIIILGIAALWLVIDFGEIEQKVAQGAPKYMEWYCAYALLVTLAWIYYEAVKLVVRVAVLFGRRD